MAAAGACSSDLRSPLAPSQSPAATDFQLTDDIGDVSVQAANQWTQLASLPFARAYTVSAAFNGRLYTIGGSDLNAIYNTVTEYNPGTNTWTTKAPMPKKLNSQLGATVIGSIVYVPGGWNGTSYMNDLLLYDPVANSWSSGPPMPIPGACGGSAAISGILYVAIGCDFSGVTAKLLSFDPATKQWTPLPSAPGSHSAGTVVAANGKLYWDNGSTGTGTDVYDPVANSWSPAPTHITKRISAASATLDGVVLTAGGYTIGTVVNTTEYLDEKGAKWLPRANMVAATGAASSAVLNGEWYVVGGNGPGSLNTIATVQKYTPGDLWLTANSMATPRGHLTATTVGTSVYAIGGRVPSNVSGLTTNEVYSSASGTWQTKSPLPAGRWGAASAAVGGRVFVIGGFSGDSLTTATNTVYAYTPATDTWTVRASAPTPIGFASAAVIGGKIFVQLGTDGTTFDGKKVYRYDPAADAWSVIQDSPGAHSQGVSVGVAQYFASIGGGGSGSAGKAVDGFNINQQNWLSSTPAPVALVGASGGAIGTRIYIAFGSQSGTYTAATNVFDGVTKLWSSRGAAPEALAFAAAAVTNGELLTVGGFRQNATATGVARRYVP